MSTRLSGEQSAVDRANRKDDRGAKTAALLDIDDGLRGSTESLQDLRLEASFVKVRAERAQAGEAARRGSYLPAARPTRVASVRHLSTRACSDFGDRLSLRLTALALRLGLRLDHLGGSLATEDQEILLSCCVAPSRLPPP